MTFNHLSIISKGVRLYHTIFWVETKGVRWHFIAFQTERWKLTF